MKQAEVAVAQAEARLRQLRELQLPVAGQALRQAEANLANAQAQYDRNKRLSDSGFIGQVGARRRRSATSMSRAPRSKPRASRSKRRSRRAATPRWQSARSSRRARACRSARAKLGYTTIGATWDGTLIARDVERGDVVQPGKVLMVLSPAGETQIVLQIDERNLGRLMDRAEGARLGRRVSRRNGSPRKLVYINPGVDAQRGTVEVKLRVPQPPAYLKQDMTVSVDIEVGRAAGALDAARADAVHDARAARPGCCA